MNPLTQEPYYHNLRSELRHFIPHNPRRVLEIGCGAGFFRNNLPEDCEYWGVEMVSEVGQEAASRLDKVFIGSYDSEDHNLPDDYFDLIVCNDVIEHMNDHDLFLQKIQKK